MRSMILAAIVFPLVFLSFTSLFNWAPPMAKLTVDAFLLLFAMTVGVPTREGIWVGTWLIYRRSHHVLPNLIVENASKRSKVRIVGSALHVTDQKNAFYSKNKYLRIFNVYGGVPHFSYVADGLFNLDPGGHRAVLQLEGPPVSLSSESYGNWCDQVMQWLMACECPVQFLTVVDHFDDQKAFEAYAKRVEVWPRTPLREMEQELAVNIANQSLGLRHYVIFAPKTSVDDGIPHLSKISKLSRHSDTSRQDAEHVLESAVRLAEGFSLSINRPDRHEMLRLTENTILNAPRAAMADGVTHIGDQYHVVMTMTKLPPTVELGIVVDALMRATNKGFVSLHIYPVDVAHAQRVLHRKNSMLTYAAQQSSSAIEAQVAMQDTADVLAGLAQRTIKPVRIALSIDLHHGERDKAHDALERLVGVLSGAGFQVTQVTSPGFLPVLSVAPGWVPLGRSLMLTSDGVALRMLPALGTPFSDITAPLVGINAMTGAPAYFSVWNAPNHNVVIVGSSGAGKSVTTKTLLIRHVMEGVSAVVIDPDSEYRHVITAVGGRYFELGEEAINPLEAGMYQTPDAAASLILPILSVMAGDEKGVKDGRPIRRLPDEDQGWIHSELTEFYRSWILEHPGSEPVMHNLIEYLQTESVKRTLTEREAERIRIISARLIRFTQGNRAQVFDRPSTFSVGRQPIAIGLKIFALTYGADLTPALAVILTSILSALDRRDGRLIVVVDEAHRVTSDPDAGEVLGQLVRQARKYGAGVWMCSQQIDDFVSTQLGRTLAATAATKLILGTEESNVDQVKEVFSLHDDEVGAISPIVRGRGVLLSSGERTVVHVIPGPAIMALADTSQASRGQTSSTPAA
ncbi:MAG: VirB4 family type IV secretion system protein [Candidatus Dormibacteria bacterium]